MFWELLE